MAGYLKCGILLLATLFVLYGIADGSVESVARVRRETQVSNVTIDPDVKQGNETVTHAQDGWSTGLIIGIVVAVIVVIALVALVIFYVLKIRSRGSSEMEREAKVQMTTSKNAGVYVDLATNPEQEDKEVKETDKLKSAEEA
ncbi:hypothetical protein SNE40_015877 [Patella caerulea]|uniref:Uncharacterized protein n=1 Tax=Patella caerulea TaxID=87958 RepID=A0AAN8J8V5_PATCE